MGVNNVLYSLLLSKSIRWKTPDCQEVWTFKSQGCWFKPHALLKFPLRLEHSGTNPRLRLEYEVKMKTQSLCGPLKNSTRPSDAAHFEDCVFICFEHE